MWPNHANAVAEVIIPRVEELAKKNHSDVVGTLTVTVDGQEVTVWWRVRYDEMMVRVTHNGAFEDDNPINLAGSREAVVEQVRDAVDRALRREQKSPSA